MCGRKRWELLYKHAHTLSQAPDSRSVSEHSVQGLYCQWWCYKLQRTGNPLTLCPYISYATINAYYKCLRGIINISAVLCACLHMLNNVLDPLKKMVALPLSSLEWNLKRGFHPICLCGSVFFWEAFYHLSCLPPEQSICYHSFVMI